jgi:TonB family protein
VPITGAPAGGLTYPETPDAAVTGIVNLKALIAVDGTVREVVVLSGKHALASSAVRAVRHWRYRAPEMNGEAAEAETLITFNFIGPDAVSISFPAQK